MVRKRTEPRTSYGGRRTETIEGDWTGAAFGRPRGLVLM